MSLRAEEPLLSLERRKMKLITLIPALSGFSCLLTSWLLLLNRIPSNAISWGFFIFYFIVFFLSMAILSGYQVKEKEDKHKPNVIWYKGKRDE